MKKSIFFLLCASMGLVATAQTINKENLIDECQRLYSDGEYTTALSLLERLDIEKLDKEKKQEAELLIALNTYESDAATGRTLMQQYLIDYPESTQKGLLDCYIAQSYYHTGDYEAACDKFKECNFNLLTAKQREEATLYHALSLINTGNEGAGENKLHNLLTSRYLSADATFHLAVINYNRAVTNYDRDMLYAAQEGFIDCETHSEKFKLEVQYYNAGIYIKEGDYDHALRVAEHTIKAHGNTIQGIKMHQMLGAAYFMKEDYENAAKAFEVYMKKYHTPQRIAMYQYGKSLFELGKYDEAMKMLIVCADGDDAIAQNALLHVGLIHLENGNAKDARLPLGGAADLKFDDRVREEALYNYAMCVHATNYSPFGESVKTFEQFLNDYPNSIYADKVGEILVEEYTKTRNYDIALQSINKIKNPSTKILVAKQSMLYHKGIQEFVNGNMDNAISYLDQALNEKETTGSSQSWKGEALFWKGEALFRKGNMSAARNSYGKALAIDEKGNHKAIYGIAYTYFKEKNYKKARTEFERYAKVATTEGYDLLADTYSRIADCHLYQKNYDKAEDYYAKSVKSYKPDADYSLYRLAQIQGLKNNKNKCIATLEDLVNNYPSSPYNEQALYELGRTHIKKEQYNEAIKIYNKLIEKYPNGDAARRALAEKAMIYDTIGESEKAVKTYKQIIDLYPQSDEAKVAAQDLMGISIEMGKGNEYAEYMAKRDDVLKVSSSSIDSLAYATAEKLYGRGDLEGAKVAFENYLSSYPDGAFCGNSYYHKGVISYKQNNKDEALSSFEQVLNYTDNKYLEDAMVLAADIYYEKENFDKSTPMYEKIFALSSNDERRNTALTRMLRADFIQENYEKVIGHATTIEKDSKFSPEFKREANLCCAKAYLALKKHDHATEALDILAEDTRTKEGAEAKYLVSQLLFDEGSYDYCEDEINEFINNGTPHKYWMARSFILLVDLYTKQGKTMEAKQYLQSLKSNYDGKDDIADMIKERQAKLRTENKQK